MVTPHVLYRVVGLTQSRNPTRATCTALPREVVERAEAYVRAHMDAPLPLSTLCRLVGLSERGLRNAFYRVHGLGPKQWMRAERLLAARNALRDGDNPPATVTDVATDFGFYELGRFAAQYRKAFGEVPSATLRGRASRRILNETTERRAYRCLHD